MTQNKLYTFLASKVNFYTLYNFLFIVFTLLGIHYVFATTFFVTLDGSEHVATSNVLCNYYKDAFLYSNFEINYSVPNSLCHIILSKLILFIGPIDAERIIVLMYFIFLPISFFLAIKSFNFNNETKPINANILLFAILYNFLFHLGFYNFLLAVIFLNIHIYLLNKIRTKTSILYLALIPVNLLVLYYTHGIIFIVAFLYSGLIFIFTKKQHFKSIFQFALIHVVPAIIAVINFFKFKVTNFDEDINFENKLKKIYDFSPNVVYVENEKYLNYFYLALFVLLMVYGLFKAKQNKNINYASPRFCLIILSVILLIILLTVKYGFFTGMFTDRMAFLFFYILIFCLSTINIKSYLLNVIVIITVCFIFKNNYTFRKGALSALNNNVKDVYALSEKINSNSYIYKINYSDNWLHNHFANYLTYKSNSFIINDNQASLGWFITKLKQPNKIYQMNINIENKNYDKFNIPNYICLLGSENKLKNNDVALYEFVNEHYSIIDKKGDMCTLFKMK